MECYFIRHAESFNNRLWTTQGGVEGRDPDPELTDLGRQQNEHLARALGIGGIPAPAQVDYQNVTGYGITHLYSSLMVRALETARALAHTWRLPILGVVEAHEFGGIFEYGAEWARRGLPGRTPAELRARFPELVVPPDVSANGWWQARHETHRDMLQRARRVVAWLQAHHGNSDDRVALVSHGGFYQTFLYALLQLNLPDDPELPYPFRFYLNNTGITRCILREGRVILAYMNRTAHLPAELLTI